MKDYYDILQVSPNAEQEVIDAAYRRLARKYHPDVYSGPDAADRMRELNEAYEVLSNPRRRAEYDAATGRAQARAGARRPQEDRAPPPPPADQAKRAESSAPEESSPKRRTLRPGWLGLAAGSLLALAVAGAITAAVLITSGQGSEKPVTQLYRYAPRPSVTVLPSSEDNRCWTSSIASGRFDAFRCSLGNFIHDPCFTYGANTLICPGDPRTTADDVAFTFDASAVPSSPRLGENVWFMVVNGEDCYAVTGTRPFVGDKYFDFGCSKTLYCTKPVQGAEGFVSDCWHRDSSAENIYTVAEVWY